MRRQMLNLSSGVYRVKQFGHSGTTLCNLQPSNIHSEYVHTYFASWPNPDSTVSHDVGYYMWDRGHKEWGQWGDMLTATRVSPSEEEAFRKQMKEE